MVLGTLRPIPQVNEVGDFIDHAVGNDPGPFHVSIDRQTIYMSMRTTPKDIQQMDDLSRDLAGKNEENTELREIRLGRVPG